MNLLFVGFIWCVSHFVCYFSVKRKSVKMHLDDLLCCKFNSPWCFYLSVFLLLVFYSSLILFCGLKDRLNQYLQHKKTKFNLLREEYFRAGSIYPGARQKGETWRIMKSSVGQEMRFCWIYARACCCPALCLKCIFFTDRYFFYSQWQGHSGYEGLSGRWALP